MAFDINEWFNLLSQKDVILKYKGEITSELITDVLNEAEIKIEKYEVSTKLRKKLYNILVESLQNLYHHIVETPDEFIKLLDSNFALFFVIKDDSFYKIITGNFVSSDKAKYLRDRVDLINNLSVDELKALYKLILNNEEFSEKGGGGLGMIDIARKSGNKLEYQFYEINNIYYFYSLTVLVD